MILKTNKIDLKKLVFLENKLNQIIQKINQCPRMKSKELPFKTFKMHISWAVFKTAGKKIRYYTGSSNFQNIIVLFVMVLLV